MDIFLIVCAVLVILQLIAMVWSWRQTKGYCLGLGNRILVCIFWPVLFVPFNVQ
jgi:hypothetical protein